MSLFDSTGRSLLKIDSLTAPGAPLPAEEVHWVAKTSGELRFEVELQNGPRQPCPLRLEARRPATAADRARTLAETALARAHELRRPQEEKRCREAITLYQQAQRQFADLGLPSRRTEALRGESMVRQHLGELRFRKGDLDGAIAEYRQTLTLWRRLDNRAGEALTSNNLGLALQVRGHYDKAAALFDRALSLGQEGDPLEGARTHLNR
ncbi:MAG: Tetratricopeptide repeat, partial [Acidobacteriota bacterium]|nr:Tetratricopeptide repeat [Acidobacteriota bacterium]